MELLGNDQVGNTNFTINASDGKSETSQVVFITVINKNDPPVINRFIEKQTFNSKQENRIQLPVDCIIDPDANDTLSYTLSMDNNSALPDWLNFDPLTLTLTGNPAEVDIGQYGLKLTATE